MDQRRRKRNLSILMITSEAVPHAKAGGLADAVSALSEELDRLGHDVRLLMPRYYGIRKDRLYRHPAPFTVRVGSERYTTALYEGRIGDSEVAAYFLDYEALYGRDGIYGAGGSAYADNLRRFSLLCHAAVAIGPFLGWEPSVLHAHDWPAALVPLLVRRRTDRGDRGPATVLTLHNVGYQGVFPVADLPAAGLEWTDLPDSGLLHEEKLNLLKAGIINAEMVTTVSPQYAADICTPRRGFSLDPVLAARGDALVGILNGVDYAVWSPEKDPFLDVKYTVETVALKSRIKRSLQQELGLPARDDAPMIGLVSRLVEQKGLEELVSPGFGALPAILSEHDVQIVVLGSGEEKYEHHLRALARRFPNLVVVTGFSERLAHLVEAASDFFLMPSRYEPCGLNQLYSLRYGTLPIVTRTGGLADTVEPAGSHGGTGFFIEENSPESVIAAVAAALDLWRTEPARIDAMRRNAMRQRFPWTRAAARYLEVYGRAISARDRASS